MVAVLAMTGRMSWVPGTVLPRRCLSGRSMQSMFAASPGETRSQDQHRCGQSRGMSEPGQEIISKNAHFWGRSRAKCRRICLNPKIK